MSASTPLAPGQEIIYPDSDGQPMAENTLQFRWIVTIQGNLDLGLPHDFVAGDLFWYPVQGDPAIRTAPDVLVVFGRPKGDRGSYMQWREGHISPHVVWEILSPGNRARELQEKFEFYERYGVEEYIIYDPDRGILRVWVRSGTRLVEVESPTNWVSPRLGIRLQMVAGELEIHWLDGSKFLSFVELGEQTARERQQREAAQLTAERERRQRQAAQRQAEGERQQRETAERQTEGERQQREAAQHQAEQERQRADLLAQKLRALGIDPDAP